MNSQQLANEVEGIIHEARGRIIGVGQEQYSEGESQKFETMPLTELLDYFEEELLDQVNYAVMNLIRIRRLRTAATVLHQRFEEVLPNVTIDDLSDLADNSVNRRDLSNILPQPRPQGNSYSSHKVLSFGADEAGS